MEATTSGSAPVDVAYAAKHFDQHSPEFAQDPYAVFAYLREHDPIAWTESHGGFWVFTRYADVVEVATRDDLYSSERGIIIPLPDTYRVNIPIDIDPPAALFFRRFLHPLFAPKALQGLEESIRQLASKLVDDVIESGRCDFALDFARPLTTITTLRLGGLETENWRRYTEAYHQPDGLGIIESQLSIEQMNWVESDFKRQIQEQRESPRPGVVSALCSAEIDGRKLTVEEIEGIVRLLLAGGLESTQAWMGNTAVYLGRHPEERRKLVEDPARIPVAGEETLRYWAPTQSLARTVTRDHDYKGVRLREGDQILISWASANRDPDEFPDAERMLLDRHPNRHVSFGVGAHRCMGSNLARLEFTALFDEVLRRLPDYALDEGGVTLERQLGVVYGHSHVPLTFEPGPRASRAA